MKNYNKITFVKMNIETHSSELQKHYNTNDRSRCRLDKEEIEIDNNILECTRPLTTISRPGHSSIF
jgi:hypothetical protein